MAAKAFVPSHSPLVELSRTVIIHGDKPESQVWLEESLWPSQECHYPSFHCSKLHELEKHQMVSIANSAEIE